MKKIFFIVILFYFNKSFAQNEYMHWVMPDMPDYEINFCDSVSLNSVSNVNSTVITSGAAICNKNTGQLLFFTDGENVWNSNFQQMPNGSGLNGGWESTQPALIVPQPDSANIFYIFTDDLVYQGSNGLEYSVVDMSKNGGLGDVTVKNIFLDSSCQYITAVYNAVNNSFWIIACNYVTDDYMSFLVNSNGLDTTPVLSPSHVNILLNYQVSGCLKSSPNGQSIVDVFEYPPVIGLYNFDKSTGFLSLQTFLPVQASDGQAFSASFSPDNSKLYLSAGNASNSEIYQYTVIGNDTNAIKSSRITIDSPSVSIAGMQMGPDGKIYVVNQKFEGLSLINKPNLSGLACEFTFNQIPIPVQNNNYGFSNNIDGLYYFATAPNITLSSDGTGCNKTVSFAINTQKTYNYFNVYFGDGTSVNLDSTQYTFTHQYDSAGAYTVKLYTQIGCVYDSATTTVTVTSEACPQPLIIPTLIYGRGSQTQWSIINLPQGSNSVTIYDELGRTLYKTSNYLNNYDMKNLPPAMYFYRLTLVTGQEYVGKIILIK